MSHHNREQPEAAQRKVQHEERRSRRAASRGWLVLLGVVAAVPLGVPSGVAAAGLITGADIADNTITSRDLHNGSGITSADVADDSLTRADFPGAKTGRRGPAGAGGAAGPDGPLGPAGYRGTVVVASDPVVVPPGETLTLTADCPSGMKVLNGGVDNTGPEYLDVHVSEPITGGTGWAVLVEHVVPITNFEITATVHAVCTPYPGA